MYTVATGGPDGISQTVFSSSSGNLQTDGVGIISQTESSLSSENLQTDGPGIISQTVPSLSSGKLQTAGPDRISQTVSSLSSGKLHTAGPDRISQTESSPSSGNLQTLVEQIFQVDRIAWQPDSFLEQVGLKLEQKYFTKNYLRKRRRLCFVMFCLEMIGFAIFLSFFRKLFKNTCRSPLKYMYKLATNFCLYSKKILP